LAAKDINTAGGVLVGSKRYYIGITAEDTDESNPNIDTNKGVAAAERIVNYKQCQYVLGGFRTESVKVYLETILNAKLPFISVGVATDSFCGNVRGDPLEFPDTNYERYKYFFRIMPINSTSLGGEIFSYLLTFAAMNGVNKFGIIYEDLDWTEPTVYALKTYIPLLGMGFGAEVVASVGYPTTVDQNAMDTYIDQIDANNTQILIPVISAQGGIYMMDAYARKQPGFVINGIDVQSQLDTFWDDTNGACLYETCLQAVYAVNKTSTTVDFFERFAAEYGKDPLYTGVGAYDAVQLYASAINETQSFAADDIIDYLEGFNKANYYEGVSGLIAFTPSHDQYEGYPYGYTLFVQWQPGPTPGTGKKVVVPSITSTGYIYPPSLWTGTYLLPEWPGWAFNT
jgi:branched-chain amino acid transport system substrate-binding protein